MPDWFADILAYVLHHLSAKSHGEGLHATADAEHGYLPVVCQSCEQQLRQVPFCVYTMQMFRRFLASPKRIVVCATCEDNSVETVESVNDDMLVGNRRNDDRHASGPYYLTVIKVAQRGIW